VKRTTRRLVGTIMVHTLIVGPGPVPARGQTAPVAPAALPPAPGPPPPVANRTRPALLTPPPKPSFSIWPSAWEISRARVFEEPLVPAEPTSRRENRALARALARYVEANTREDARALEEFLAAHPASPWRVSLLANLGRRSDTTRRPGGWAKTPASRAHGRSRSGPSRSWPGC
jgi:hypothetical protein